MIYNINLNITSNRENIIQYILQKKKEGTFTVIDIGGSINGWSIPIIDMLVDVQTPTEVPSHIRFFHCDITHPDSWKEIHEYVKNNGKFDFSICSHTLEDIMNPGYVCEQLSKISKEGYIAVPTKYIELSKIEGPYRGYIHHRWIFVIRNGEFIGYPKLNIIDYLDYDSKILNKNHYSDLSFYWKDEIHVNYLNNNYMGPNVNAVIQYFLTLTDKDDYD